jgi:pyruvate formate lyase activating enzyme
MNHNNSTSENILAAADYFLFDLKLADEKEHIRYTGVSNKLIRKNFKKLAASGKSFVTRIPLIPGVTDTEHNIEAIAEFMNKNGVFYAELMPYNKMAGGKYKAIGMEYRPDFDPTAEVKIRKDIFKNHNIEITIL